MSTTERIAELEQRISELVEKVALLKGDNTNAAVDALVDEIDATLTEISDKSGYAPAEFRAAVQDRYTRYLDEEQESFRDQHENPFDDSNWPNEPIYQGPVPDDDPFWSGPPKKD